MNATVNEEDWSFDDWAESYDSDVMSPKECFARYDDVLDAVVAAAGISRSMRVLDIGVGTGNLALRCAERGAEVVGLDPSPGMLAKAREKITGRSDIELRFADDPFSNSGYPDASFDAVVSTYAFHHVAHESKPEAVQEMSRVVRSGGVIAIGDLMFEDRAAKKAALEQYEWLDDEYFSYLTVLRSLFDEHGMTLVSRRFTPVTWVVHAVRG